MSPYCVFLITISTSNFGSTCRALKRLSSQKFTLGTHWQGYLQVSPSKCPEFSTLSAPSSSTSPIAASSSYGHDDSHGVPVPDFIAGRGAGHGCAACRGYAAAVADSPRGSHFYAPSYGSALPIAAARRRDTDHIASAGDITACQPANRWHSYIAGGRRSTEQGNMQLPQLQCR